MSCRRKGSYHITSTCPSSVFVISKPSFDQEYMHGFASLTLHSLLLAPFFPLQVDTTAPSSADERWYVASQGRPHASHCPQVSALFNAAPTPTMSPYEQAQPPPLPTLSTTHCCLQSPGNGNVYLPLGFLAQA